VIEVKYDDLPAETCLTTRDSARTLVAGHSTSSFSAKGSASSKTMCCDRSQDDFPAEKGLTIRDCAGALVVGQSTGSFSTKGGAVSKTAYIAKGAYTFEMSGTYGDGICYRYGAREFKLS
jgi:hypothetical protein